jgi:metallo-beta-lactamase family protein
MELIHHGAHHGVTGSCHQLRFDSGKSILIDCGLFQGEDARRHPELEIEFSLEGVEALLVTHVHIDHVGRIPYLMAAGFEGPIYCTAPTAKMLPLTMEDAIKIGFTRKQRMIDAFLETVDSRLHPLRFQRWYEILPGVRVRMTPAGHILGSCVIEVEADGQTVVFSGDLGATHTPLLKDPVPPPRADILVLESTYGDRIHDGRDQRQRTLERVLRRTLDDKGVTIIPAFSLGRTQELLYEMNGIFERIQKQNGRSIMKSVDVIVDSPLACRFTEVYEQLQPFWDEEAQRVLAYDDQPLVFENLTTIEDHDEHLSTLDYLDRTELPAIVLAGSGMCTGGRVVNYLKRFLDRKTTDVLFVGYQGSGTPGRDIQSGKPTVKLDGDEYTINADIYTITGYSAHADQQNLVDFVTGIQKPPERVVLVHGETDAKRALASKLSEQGMNAVDSADGD